MSNYNKLIDRFDRIFLYFINKIIINQSKPLKKFYIDICYGIIKSKNIVLSDIAFSLNEKILLKKTIERLSKFLNLKIDKDVIENFYKTNLSLMKSSSLYTFIVDDTDVIKPYGNCFEYLGKVKDGSSLQNSIEKGYRVTSIVGLSSNTKHPLPFVDSFHSETMSNFTSVNNYTKDGLLSIINMIDDYKGVFIFDRGYDDSKLFRFFNQNKQYFVVRLTKRRKVIIKNRSIKLIELAKKKKGKITIPLTYKGKKMTSKAYHTKVKLNGFKEYYYVIFNYLDNATEPLMLLTNREIKSKEDVISIVLNYSSRWKIEEYFRFKKVEFNFEDFRVRKLNRINHIAFCLDISISFLTSLIENKSNLYYILMGQSKNLTNDSSYLKYYQLISGILLILGHKETGIKNKEKIEHRPKQKQLTLF